MKLEKLGNKAGSVVNAEDPIDRAIGQMWHLNIRHLPVVRESVPMGMVSERDVLFHICWLDRLESGLAGDRDQPAGNTTELILNWIECPVLALKPPDFTSQIKLT